MTFAKPWLQAPVWQNAWDVEEKVNLLRFAILLSNVSLTGRTLDEIKEANGDELEFRFRNPYYYYDEKSLYTIRAYNDFSIKDFVLMGKNEAIINKFLSFYQTQEWSFEDNEMVYFIIARRDLYQLSRYCEEHSEDEELFLNSSNIANKHLNVHSVHRLLPIGFAITLNWLEGVQLMIESKIPFIKEKGDTFDDDAIIIHPLSLAVELGRVEIIKYLLSRRINPNGFDNPETDALPPIFYAVKQNSLPLVKLLVSIKLRSKLKIGKSRIAIVIL